MTVYKRADRGGRWRYDFWEAGVRYRGYCEDPDNGTPARDQKTARDFEGEVRRRVKQATAGNSNAHQPGSFTIGQALTLHIGNQASSTTEHVANLRMYAAEILRFFKPNTPVVEITVRNIQEYRHYASAQMVKIWIGGADKKRDRGDERWWKQGDRRRSPAGGTHNHDCLRGGLLQAHKSRDPLTGQPMLPFPPTVEPLAAPKRLPRPIPDAELERRLEKARPWVRDAAHLARLFGLRMDEVSRVTIEHIDERARCLRFRGEDQKSGRDEEVHGGAPGWQLLRRLKAQAIARGQKHLVTWPGAQNMWRIDKGEDVPKKAWRPLKSVRKAWSSTAGDAVERPHRFHDLRARYITQIAGSASAANTRRAARHKEQSTTDRYIEIENRETANAVRVAMTRQKRPRRAGVVKA
jgi:integrase